MNIRLIVKCFESWAITSIVGGALIGSAMCLGDTGHLGTLGTLLLLSCAGAFFGFADGIPFALLFARVAPHLPTRARRASAAVVLGALSGLVGISVVNGVLGIANADWTGSVAGAITGFLGSSLGVTKHDV